MELGEGTHPSGPPTPLTQDPREGLLVVKG